MRHGMCHAVAKLRGGKHLADIQRLLDDPEFDHELAWACKSDENMNSERGRNLHNKLAPVMTMAGRKMAWSPGERIATSRPRTNSLDSLYMKRDRLLGGLISVSCSLM